MLDSPVFWIAAVLVLLGLGGYLWYTRHPTVDDVLRGRVAVADGEAAALEALLAAADVPPRAVRLVTVSDDAPCWYGSYRDWLDYRLGVYRQFGRYGDNCIGVDRGQVVGVSLVFTALTDLAPLADLPALRHVQLREARIASLAGVPAACGWTHLVLQRNDLVDLKPLAGCAALEALDVSFNRVESVPPLQDLGRLRTLDLRQNRITDLAWVTGQPALERLDLAGNPLGRPEGLSSLPRLEFLNLSDTDLMTLRGLRDLPSLRVLQAASNRLEAVTTDVLAGLPALRSVALDNNNIRDLPEGYAYAGPGYGPFVVRPADGLPPDVSLRMNPVADGLRAEAEAAHDSRRVYAVERLPRGRGRVQDARRRGRTGYGIGANVAYEGTMAWLDGTYRASFDLDRALGVTVTASVETGRLRVYLAGGETGYVYAEGIPGKPIELSGRLLTGTSTYFVYFESVNGRASGIRWTADG